MANYKNAGDILPKELLVHLQQYAEGELLYIPRRGRRVRWGERSGSRAETDRRNAQMRREYREGHSIDELAAKYHLSVETIRKIVRGARREQS